MKLENRGVVVTGASQGLGKAIAEACVREGAHVLICARDANLLSLVKDELQAIAAPGRHIVALPADVSSREDVQRLMQAASHSLPVFDCLINNAGIYGPKGPLEEVDLAEWWRAIEINLLGVALPCSLALPVFRRQNFGKIINLSGGGATAPLPRLSAYAASKAAVVRLTETLAEETAGTGIDINAIAPGALNTRLLDEILAEGPSRVGEKFFARSLKQKEEGGASLENAAGLCIFLLSHESDGITGRLISAVWDPWRDLPSRREELMKSDVYTLRRIIPEDRNLKWE